PCAMGTSDLICVTTFVGTRTILCPQCVPRRKGTSVKKLLTDALVRNLPPPASGRLEVADQSCRGLWLRVTSAGAKTFAFRYRARDSRRSERKTLGAYPDVSLGDAPAGGRQAAPNKSPAERIPPLIAAVKSNRRASLLTAAPSPFL